MKERVKQVFDEWLVLSYKSGNHKAMALLVKRWNQKIIRHIYYRTHDLEVSKDLTQDCWIAIMNGLQRLRDPAEFGVWALRIANNKAVDWIRKQAKERQVMESKAKMEDHRVEITSKEDKIEAIQSAYQLLEKKHRLLLNLHYRQNYSVKQMAKVLNISEGTVKSRLFKARKELKKLLK